LLPRLRLVFSRQVSRDYAEKHMYILLNRKYQRRKRLILLMFHVLHNVNCVLVNVKIVKITTDMLWRDAAIDHAPALVECAKFWNHE
jgi:hypothetical protein